VEFVVCGSREGVRPVSRGILDRMHEEAAVPDSTKREGVTTVSVEKRAYAPNISVCLARCYHSYFISTVET